MSDIQTVEVETGAEPSASVIWLHGLGADGHDFEPIVPELRMPDTLPLRFVFPHAPVRPVTINGGMAMRAWYDIISFDRGGPADAVGINESTAALEALIAREEQRGIESGRVVVAGFSQGGAIAINTALRTESRLLPGRGYCDQHGPAHGKNARWINGVVDLARAAGRPAARCRGHVHTGFHGSRAVRPDDTDAVRTFLCRCARRHPMIPMQYGRSSADALAGAGFSVEWHDYPMARSTTFVRGYWAS
jgi:phospholipase/carboxylesterase